MSVPVDLSLQLSHVENEMKRLLVTVSTALALTLLPSLAFSGARADASSVANSFAVGGGDATCVSPGYCATPSLHFALSAHCAETAATQTPFCVNDIPGFNTPVGHAVFRFTDASGHVVEQVQGKVTCEFTFLPTGTSNSGTQGGFASFTFQVTKATGSSPPTSPYLTFEVFDSAQGGGTGDLISDPLETTDPDSCQFPPETDHAVTNGNIVVALQSNLVAVPLQGSWWSVDSNGNLYIQDSSGRWVLVQ